MKNFFLIGMGVIVGIYLMANHPSIAQLIWDTAMEWAGRIKEMLER